MFVFKLLRVVNLRVSCTVCVCVCVCVTGFAKRGLTYIRICAIINVEKFHFEILNTVYLKNA